MRRSFYWGHGVPRVCRLGLATRGGSRLAPGDVRHALSRGVNHLNWCGHSDGLSRAIAELRPGERNNVVISWQLTTNSARTARQKLDDALRELKTDWIDLVTFYYVESEQEWRDLTGASGAYEVMVNARTQGKVRLLGLTSHQRKLAVRIAASEPRPLDFLMLRYNAAHRGAEREVFPTTDALRLPVIAFTCLRWGALLQPTRDDPPGFVPPRAPAWYRFVLANPSVAAALMAPDNRGELDENLQLFDDWRAPTRAQRHTLLAHGDRVYRHAGEFW